MQALSLFGQSISSLPSGQSGSEKKNKSIRYFLKFESDKSEFESNLFRLVQEMIQSSVRRSILLNENQENFQNPKLHSPESQ